ncbi:class I SAM-dependent methyltransferase [Ferribacterium limneticum]|uniref:class I SAM-dependent methyltransferase n=1 Tax=Ferribacterium limneticum TaxID=76259 RepID=UPI00384B085A
MGFSYLEGVDPYVASDIDYANGVSVRKGEIDSVAGGYDLVMMHHSLEHVPDPVSTLTAIAKITNPQGCVLIRVPVVDCEAWDIYQENWVQLDAPRHLHLFSRKSIEALAKRCGFVVENVIYDSHAMQFWASEQYRKGISLRDPRSVMTDAKSSIFSKAEIRTFGKRATLLNKSNRGDQACFFLRPVASNMLNSKCSPALAEIQHAVK